MGKRYVPRHLDRGEEKKRPGVAVVAVPAACVVLLAILIGVAVGRYQRELSSEGVAKARDFYFTSNFLDGETHTLSADGTGVSFKLGNHADDLRFSEVDIAYEVTVTLADGTAAPGVTVTNGSNTLAKDAKSDQEVTIGGLSSGNTYTVTAVGKGGYEQTLTATIEVLSGEPVVYKYLDTTNSEYVLLTVWAQGYTGAVTITPPANLIPDNTDLAMATAQTGAAFTDAASFSTDAFSSHTYRFFGGGVTVDDFTVTYASGSKTAEVKTPS